MWVAGMRKQFFKGFSLVELLIVIVIIGIIAAFAYPSYRNHIVRTHRSDAIKALTTLSINQERFLALNNSYSNSASELGMTTSPDGYYELKVFYGRWSGSDCSTASDDTSNTRRYTLMAIPVAGKSQAEDTDCGCLYIDDIGSQQAAGNNTARCWK